MKKHPGSNILTIISTIHESSRKFGLAGPFLDKTDKALAIFSRYLGAIKIEAYFTAIIFSLSYNRRHVDISYIAEHLGCSPLKVLEYYYVFESLRKKGILVSQGRFEKSRYLETDNSLGLSKKLINAILKNEVVEVLRKTHFDDALEFIDHVWSLSEQLTMDEIKPNQLLDEITCLLNANKKLELARHLLSFQLEAENSYVYLMLIWNSLQARSGLDLDTTLKNICYRTSDRIRQMQSFANGQNQLIRNKLCTVVEGNYLGDCELVLTDHARGLLSKCNLNLKLRMMDKEDVFHPSMITPRDLIFDKQEMKQLELLQETLMEPNFSAVRQRMASQNLVRGITAVLHGPPGTGKTESVMQLARITGREILGVDISETKSMWYGQSERRIRDLFHCYKHYAESSENTPILLFNEADGVLSRRRHLTGSSVNQTENSVQNILLEEMERFDGILIATTNMVTNLDKAFERRFLFKIKFNKPGHKQRFRIWELKVPGLKEEAYEILAASYSFSGGQIDNIARKKEIQEVVHGKKCQVEDILVFCNDELLETNTPRIGYALGN